MKARHIRKLRKQIQAFKTFRITVTTGLFGDFFFIKENKLHEMKASSEIHAIHRYMRWYFRRYKQRNPHHKDCYIQTTEKFGEVLVINDKGYKRYYY